MLHFYQKTPLHCIYLRVSHCTLLVTSSLAWLVTHNPERGGQGHPAVTLSLLSEFPSARGRGRGHVECHNKYEKWHCDGPGSMGPSKDQSYAKWTHLMVIYYHTSRSENKNINISFSSSFPIIILCPALTYFKTSWLIFVFSYSVFEFKESLEKNVTSGGRGGLAGQNVTFFLKAFITVNHKKVSWNVVVQGLNH